MTEELQAGIDSMRDLIKDACITDIASASVRFFRELLDELDELRAQLAAAQAKLDAVPVGAIQRICKECNDFDDVHWDTVIDINCVNEWLNPQVQP